MRNIEELKLVFLEYFERRKSSSGINLFLSDDEKKCLLDYFGCNRLNECMHILINGYMGICKICQKRTEYIDVTKLYRNYCSRDCYLSDSELHKEVARKGSETKKKNPPIIKIKKTEISCLECSDKIVVSVKNIKGHLGYCDLHKKKCKNCNKRHNKAGKTCSNVCANNLKKITNLKNYGVTHNLLRRGSRPNQIEFYLNKGLSYEESNSLLSNHQLSISKNGNTIDVRIKKSGISDISEYFIKLTDKIKKFNNKDLHKPYELISLFCNNAIIEKYGFKYIYNRIYKIDNDIFKYKRIKIKKSKFGNHIYTKDGVLLRSKLEYDFYRILECNNITNYIIGKSYPKSKYKYDFYLVDFDIYVEIAGMMKNDSYFNKMMDKKSKFPNLIILETYKEMISFVQKLKSKNEDKKN